MLPLVIFAGCRADQQSALERIWKQNRITVITDNNAHCFYNYRDESMGFEYDLAQAFADYLVVDLKVITPGWDTIFDALFNGWGDFIAASLTRTAARAEQVHFSTTYLSVQQHIIVHQSNHDLNSIADLAGQTIHVRRGTSYQERLEQLRLLEHDVPITVMICRVQTFGVDTPADARHLETYLKRSGRSRGR